MTRKSINLNILFGILFLLATTPILAQSSVEHIAERQYKINRTGMTVLSSWAILNLGIGLSRMGQTTGEQKHFHQMNAMWNTVNLGIGAVGFFTAASMLESSSMTAVMGNQMSMERILLVNAGLDVGYIMTGFFLKERGINKSSDRLKGYGKSLILQGGFLMLFDIILYSVHHTNYDTIMEGLENVSLGMNPQGGLSLSLSLSF